MTVEYLVEQIFSRHREMPSDKRWLTAREFVALRQLMLNEESKGTVRRGLGGSLAWMAPGQVKYVLTEDRMGSKHSLVRMSGVAGEKPLMLFGEV